jgi:mannose-6-phosphate isomerase
MTWRPEPLLLRPILKHRAWGSDRLRRFGKAVAPGETVGESWELADLPDSVPEGRSIVVGGEFDGRPLRSALAAERDAVLGIGGLSKEGGFPLLVKFLDAHEHLSVQVHPDAAYAAAVPDAYLKTEAWIILEAEPGAVLFRGVRPEVTRERFFADLEGPGVIPHLLAVPVERGDCVYLPSGICHALGAGIVAAEVQTPSDTTFRVFDWNRRDPRRPLHIAEAKRTMRFGAEQEDGIAGVVRRRDLRATEAAGIATRRLTMTPLFGVEWLDALPGAILPVVTDSMPVIWTILSGAAALHGPDGRGRRLTIGDTALMPARLDGWTATFDAASTLLRTTLPSPTDRMLA